MRIKSHLQRFLSTVEDIVQMVLRKLDTLIETSLIETIQASQMNLQPSQTRFSEWSSFRKSNQPSTKVITNMVEMRRDRVSATTEVDVVRKVERIVEKLRGMQWSSLNDAYSMKQYSLLSQFPSCNSRCTDCCDNSPSPTANASSSSSRQLCSPGLYQRYLASLAQVRHTSLGGSCRSARRSSTPSERYQISVD